MNIGKYNVRIILASLALFLISCGGNGDNTEKTQTSGNASATTIQAVLDEAVIAGIDGIFVYVDQPSKIEESYVAGIQDKATQQAADVNSLFKIASISKLFIAISAAKLVAQETVSAKRYFVDMVTCIGE